MLFDISLKNKSLFALTKFQELESCQESFKIKQKPLNDNLFLFFFSIPYSVQYD